MKCKSLFSGKNIFRVSSAELAQRMSKVKKFSRKNVIEVYVIPAY